MATEVVASGQGGGAETIGGRLMAARLESRLFGTEQAVVEAGRFVVIEKIGAGGMGKVFRAYDPELDRTVALKVLSRLQAHTERRLRREAKALARLTHPNVISIYEIGVAGAETFLAMEHIESGSLADWCRRNSTPSRARTRKLLDFMRQTAAGLAAAHTAGIVHRDLKPGNLLIGDDDRVRVADFGLATAPVPAGPVLPGIQPTDVTQTGSVLGTPAYMAPEQFSGEASVRSDEFSLCVTFAEALSGQHPFGADPDARLENITAGRIAGLSDVPRSVRRVLARGLDADPTRRHGDLSAFIEAVDRATRRRRVVMGVGVSAVALGGIGLMSPAAGPPPCIPDEALLGEAWTRERQDAMRYRFLATGDRGRYSWQAVEHRLQDAVDLWREQNVEACVNARSREPQVRDEGERGLSCSRRAAVALRLVSDRLMDHRSDRITVRLAFGGGIQTVVDCSHGFAPDSERSFELAKRLDASLLASVLGDRQTAHDEAKAVIDATSEDELLGLRSHAWNTIKWYYVVEGNPEAAAKAARAGLAAAERAGNTDLVAQLWGDLAVEAAEAGDFERAYFCLDRVDPYVERGEVTPGRRIATMYMRGQVQRAQGDVAGAIETLRQVTKEDRQVRPGSVILAWELSHLSLALRDAGQLDEAHDAAREAVAFALERLGDDHPDPAALRVHLASILFELGNGLAARTQLDLALDVLKADKRAFSDIRQKGEALRRSLTAGDEPR